MEEHDAVQAQVEPEQKHAERMEHEVFAVPEGEGAELKQPEAKYAGVRKANA